MREGEDLSPLPMRRLSQPVPLVEAVLAEMSSMHCVGNSFNA